ncbi:MAG: hypothetical protein PWQ87_139 [Candidatus Woesearchaeota archaeon]|nr:hypothetical protein [Candidatus Woesearchaeota archaeon]
MRRKIKGFGKRNRFERRALFVFLALIIGINIFSEIDLVYCEEPQQNQQSETTLEQESTDTEIKWTGEYGPLNNTNIIYSPEEEIVLWSIWNISSEGDIDIPISPDGNISDIEGLTWNCRNEINTDSQYNISCNATGIPAGNYTWSISLNYESEVYSTPLFNLGIERAEPNITLNVSKETIYQNETIEIFAKNFEDEGTLYLFRNGSEIKNSTYKISINQTFEEPVEYEIKLVYNGSENYLEKTKTETIKVLPLVFSLNLTKGNYYNLGDEVEFILVAPNGSNSKITIYRHLEQNIGWLKTEMYINIENETYPKIISLGCTNKTGNYSIDAEIEYLNITKEITKEYFVSNSIEIEIDVEVEGDEIEIDEGEEVLIGEEIELDALVSGGIPGYNYTWRLDNGTSLTGRRIELVYNEKGIHEINLTVEDAEKNSKSKSITIDVDEGKEITVRVKDPAGRAIESAYVSIGNRRDYTNENGEVKIKAPLGEQTLRVDKGNYEMYRRVIKVENEDTIDVVLKLEKHIANKINRIILFNPKDNVTLDSNEVTFLAGVSSSEPAKCSVLIKSTESDWFEEIKKFEVEESYALELNKELAKGKYQWKIECRINNQYFSSDIASFEVITSKETKNQETTIKSEKIDENIDIGSLRTKIEAGFENLDNLNMESKEVAEVLSVKKELEKALQTFERKMRDLNNLQYRDDLSSDEKKEKAEGYQEELKELEKKTISFVEVIDSENYVNYPKNEKLIQIASTYQNEKSILGKIDEDKLKELQNKLSVETKVSHVMLSFLDNQTKNITLVEKTITYSGEEDSRIFILEEISKDFAESTNAITFLEEQETIKKDPLVKFELEEKIIYYAEGFKDFESIKESNTILFSNNLISNDKNRNLITGAFTMQEVDFTSPIFGIVFISIVIVIYILFSTEAGEKIISFARISKKRKMNKINSLINDSLNYIEEGDLNNANLVFKEIKLLYEKMPQRIKKEAYESAIGVYDKINKAYLSKLIDQTIDKIRKGEKLNKIEIIERLDQAYDILNEEDKKEMQDEVENLLKIINK